MCVCIGGGGVPQEPAQKVLGFQQGGNQAQPKKEVRAEFLEDSVDTDRA